MSMRFHNVHFPNTVSDFDERYIGRVDATGQRVEAGDMKVCTPYVSVLCTNDPIETSDTPEGLKKHVNAVTGFVCSNAEILGK